MVFRLLAFLHLRMFTWLLGSPIKPVGVSEAFMVREGVVLRTELELFLQGRAELVERGVLLLL